MKHRRKEKKNRNWDLTGIFVSWVPPMLPPGLTGGFKVPLNPLPYDNRTLLGPLYCLQLHYNMMLI